MVNINKMPIMETFLVAGKHRPMPRRISASPLRNTKSLWWGKYLGIILRYILGTIKCMIPAMT